MTTQFLDYSSAPNRLTLWDSAPKELTDSNIVLEVDAHELWLFAYGQNLREVCSRNGYANFPLGSHQVATLAELNIPIEQAYLIASDFANGISFSEAIAANAGPVRNTPSVTIGIVRSDGDLEVLATLINNDGTGETLSFRAWEQRVASVLSALRAAYPFPDIANNQIKAFARADMPDVLSRSNNDDWQEIDL